MPDAPSNFKGNLAIMAVLATYWPLLYASQGLRTDVSETKPFGKLKPFLLSSEMTI